MTLYSRKDTAPWPPSLPLLEPCATLMVTNDFFELKMLSPGVTRNIKCGTSEGSAQNVNEATGECGNSTVCRMFCIIIADSSKGTDCYCPSRNFKATSLPVYPAADAGVAPEAETNELTPDRTTQLQSSTLYCSLFTDLC